MFIKSTFYTLLLLQFCFAIITAGSVENVTPPFTQVEKIKAAQSGMTKCSIKSKLCKAGAIGITFLGSEDMADSLEDKSREYKKRMKGHAEDLRAATKRKDTSPNLGGAKSQRELDKVFTSGSDTLNKYDTKVANAENARKARKARRQKRRAAA